MDSAKCEMMVREFPFLDTIFSGQSLSADSIEAITVHRGDKNLIEVTPCEEHLSDGGTIDYTKSRRFWFVTTAGEVKQLSSSYWYVEAYHGTNKEMSAPSIGVQLLIEMKHLIENLPRVAYIVEVSGENWDTWIEKWYVGIYKMEKFDWVSFCKRFDIRLQRVS